VAAWGDGWYGFYLRDAADVIATTTRLEAFCHDAGRDRSDVTLSVALRDPTPADAGRLAAAGIDELVLVEAPPQDPTRAADWVQQLAARWLPVIDRPFDQPG
jgi:hypothetical protein